MGVNLEQLQSEMQVQENRGINNQEYLKDYVRFPKGEGYVVIRLLGPKNDDDPFYFGVKRHTINEKRFQCPKQFEGGYWKGNCPICDYVSGLWKQSESPDLTERQVDELRNLYSKLKGKPRYFFNCMVMEEVDASGKVLTINDSDTPKIFSTNQEVKDFILKSMIGDKTKNKKGLGDVSHPETGRNFNLVQGKNAGGWPEYKDSEFLEVSLLHKNQKQIDKWMSQLHDLVGKHRKPASAEDLTRELNIFRGLDVSNDTKFDPAELEPKAPVKTVVKSVMPDMDMALEAEDILKDLGIAGLDD